MVQKEPPSTIRGLEWGQGRVGGQSRQQVQIGHPACSFIQWGMRRREDSWQTRPPFSPSWGETQRWKTGPNVQMGLRMLRTLCREWTSWGLTPETQCVALSILVWAAAQQLLDIWVPGQILECAPEGLGAANRPAGAWGRGKGAALSRLLGRYRDQCLAQRGAHSQNLS